MIYSSINKGYNEIFGQNPKKLYLNRVDYKHDFYLDKETINLYLKLIRKSYSTFGFLKRNHKYSSSIYYKNKSISLNIYDRGEVIEGANYLRTEVQVRNRNIRYCMKKDGLVDCLSNYISFDMNQYYLIKYLTPILMKGDYYKLYDAGVIINKHYSQNMADKLRDFMAYIGRHGIDMAKKKYPNTFSTYKGKLENIDVNPIPIPKNIKGINTLPSLLININPE